MLSSFRKTGLGIWRPKECHAFNNFYCRGDYLPFVCYDDQLDRQRLALRTLLSSVISVSISFSIYLGLFKDFSNCCYWCKYFFVLASNVNIVTPFFFISGILQSNYKDSVLRLAMLIAMGSQFTVFIKERTEEPGGIIATEMLVNCLLAFFLPFPIYFNTGTAIDVHFLPALNFHHLHSSHCSAYGWGRSANAQNPDLSVPKQTRSLGYACGHA